MVDMVVVDGVRYRKEDAPEPTPKKAAPKSLTTESAKATTPKNKAASPSNK